MIAVIIVTWNSAGDLIECLESLSRLQHESFCVIICDNDSRDGTREKLFQWIDHRLDAPMNGTAWSSIRTATRRNLKAGSAEISLESRSVYWCPLGTNAGFAAANNVGMAKAFADPSVSAAWLLNSDTIVDPDALSSLEAFSNQQLRPGLTGSMLLYYDDPDTVQACGGKYSLLTHKGREVGNGLTAGSVDSTIGSHDIDYVVGASMLVSRPFYETVGPMCEEYFLYFEEMDWSLRSAGRFDIAFTSQSVVYHKEGGSIGTKGRGRPGDASIYYMNRAMLRFSQIHKPLSLVTALGRVVARGTRYLAARDRAGAKAVVSAVVDWARGERAVRPMPSGGDQ
ncbi:glycosyltransferase family 2 protein [Brevundimonas subvibrioides]|uniref:Glycosyl transferase family 2 n=1 Tax=Brevundimonas subvibrioides (strain ATCC 15264 / DSM 4735 / LMG 14903 / NBRC 16000 / CB 81) TaxID=633149 RepID=D9QP32_BRESC|nr:glycosyltransferase family 2 protein [Brevundimonas subvibrioides]ADL00465.1 glycosyl transferase family 2 [Brevundimonas subvibrioides ATCC 15264]